MNCLSLSVSLLSFLVLGLPRLLGTGPCCSEGKEAKSAKDVHVSKLIGYHHLYTLYRNNYIIYIIICIFTYIYMCITVILTIIRNCNNHCYRDHCYLSYYCYSYA